MLNSKSLGKPPSLGRRGLTEGLGLRHANATLQLGAGINPGVVSEELGHSTVAITLDLYPQVLPNMQKHAAEAVANLLKRNYLTT